MIKGKRATFWQCTVPGCHLIIRVPWTRHAAPVTSVTAERRELLLARLQKPGSKSLPTDARDTPGIQSQSVLGVETGTESIASAS